MKWAWPMLLLGLWLLPGLMPTVCMADEPSLASELAEKLDVTVRVLGYGTATTPSASDNNPGNDVFEIAEHRISAELRPDFQLEWGRLSLMAKPRFTVHRQSVGREHKGDETRSNDDAYVNEYLMRFRISDRLFASWGRENLQWGPSSLLSPSNPFFSDNGRANPKREVPGMDFGRLVWIVDEAWTISAIANPDAGRQNEMSGNDPTDGFNKTYALKIDYSGPESYASAIFSHRESERSRLGFFSGRTVSDALLCYFEGSLSRGISVLYPQQSANPLGWEMTAGRYNDDTIFTTLLFGGSYTLAAGPSITLEYVYNNGGYSDSEADAFGELRQNAAAGFYAPGPEGGLAAMTLGQTARNGLRLLRRNYLLLQYSHTGIKDMLDLTMRWSQNLDDGSGQVIGIGGLYLGDHMELFAIAQVGYGVTNSEYRNVLDHQLVIGVEYTF